MLAVEHRCLQRYAIETIPARVCEGIRIRFTILVLSALKWLSGIWEPFFVQFHRTVVAPNFHSCRLWRSFKVILIGRWGTFFALIDVNCLISFRRVTVEKSNLLSIHIGLCLFFRTGERVETN
jgi:hypothetical protein